MGMGLQPIRPGPERLAFIPRKLCFLLPESISGRQGVRFPRLLAPRSQNLWCFYSNGFWVVKRVIGCFLTETSASERKES